MSKKTKRIWSSILIDYIDVDDDVKTKKVLIGGDIETVKYDDPLYLNVDEKISNIGRIINDSYCNGFFGREYDLNGSTIIAEGDEWIIVRKENGYLEFGNFQYNIPEKQNLIDKWCK